MEGGPKKSVLVVLTLLGALIVTAAVVAVFKTSTILPSPLAGTTPVSTTAP